MKKLLLCVVLPEKRLDIRFGKSLNLLRRRHGQVAKATVCKTVIPRFESGCRLQITQGVRSSA